MDDSAKFCARLADVEFCGFDYCFEERIGFSAELAMGHKVFYAVLV